MNALLGGLAGLVSVSLLYLGGLFFRRKVNRNSMVELETPFGFGDVPFGVIMGMFMGWPDVIRGFIIAFILAGIFASSDSIITKGESQDSRSAPGSFFHSWLALFILLLLITNLNTHVREDEPSHMCL